jgi:hypothetical protein
MSLTDVEVGKQAAHTHAALSNVFGNAGFSVDIRLRADELAELRRLTRESWLDVIRRAAPEKIAAFEEVGIDEYHRFSHLIDHPRIWTTEARTYSADAVNAIRCFSLFDYFDSTLPGYGISTVMPPYGDFGRSRINWRLVRPGDRLDLGPIHADFWFDAVLEKWTYDPAEIVRLKVWIPIYLEEGLTGFAYLPGSHFQKLEFVRKQQPDGAYKPYFDATMLPAPLKTLTTPCGTALMFNYNLIHQGANSERATRTRVSMEFTLDLPRAQMERRFGNLDAFF